MTDAHRAALEQEIREMVAMLNEDGIDDFIFYAVPIATVLRKDCGAAADAESIEELRKIADGRIRLVRLTETMSAAAYDAFLVFAKDIAEHCLQNREVLVNA
jgi:hypothetical protein